jgi:hypothetical protein
VAKCWRKVIDEATLMLGVTGVTAKEGLGACVGVNLFLIPANKLSASETQAEQTLVSDYCK